MQEQRRIGEWKQNNGWAHKAIRETKIVDECEGKTAVELKILFVAPKVRGVVPTKSTFRSAGTVLSKAATHRGRSEDLVPDHRATVEVTDSSRFRDLRGTLLSLARLSARGERYSHTS